MAIRRFFATKNLNESLQKGTSSNREFGMQEAFAALNHLYEAEDLDESAFESGYLESLQEDAIVESSLTAEEKVDAWHDGTRRENYKAAGIPKLQAFLEIAKRKGYDDIVAIIEGELANRGVAQPSATTTTTTSSAPNLTAPISTTEEPVSSEADADVAAPVVTLSEKDLDALLGMAIQQLGTCVLSARSVWRSAGGYTGSYSIIWQNGNGNPVKPDRAVDKVRDLTYDHNKLILLTNYFPGGLHNIDRYYSIDVPASTTYTVDRDAIYEQARQSHYYYDSELNWRFYTLAKNKANQKKVLAFLLEKVPTLTPEQAEEITIKFF